MERTERKPLRLQAYDYATPGAYFVTICTHKKRKILSKIVGQGLAPAESRLSDSGEIVKRQLLFLKDRYPSIKIDKYIIMPNHVHAIIMIEVQAAGASPCPTLSDVICAFKSLSAREYKKYYPNDRLWQTSYYDHVIRGEKDYLEIWSYIDGNPDKWLEDRFYVKE